MTAGSSTRANLGWPPIIAAAKVIVEIYKGSGNSVRLTEFLRPTNGLLLRLLLRGE